MRLYHADTSPYVRKVMMLIKETGQEGDIALTPATGTPVDPATMPVGVNPLGKIPTLERPDGPPIFDSRVICRYLSDRAGGALYPPAPRLWQTLTLEAMADGICDAAILMVYETRVRPEEIRLAAWTEGQWAKIARTLDVLEAGWLDYLGGRLEIGQIALAAALGYLDLRHGGRDWRAGHPGLAAWHAQFATKPSYAETAPPAA